jgi:hypothetical protein
MSTKPAALRGAARPPPNDAPGNSPAERALLVVRALETGPERPNKAARRGHIARQGAHQLLDLSASDQQTDCTTDQDDQGLSKVTRQISIVGTS